MSTNIKPGITTLLTHGTQTSQIKHEKKYSIQL